MSRKYKKLKGCSVKEVAEVAKVTRQSVYNWAKGKGPYVAPDIEAAIKSLTQNTDHEHAEIILDRAQRV